VGASEQPGLLGQHAQGAGREWIERLMVKVRPARSTSSRSLAGSVVRSSPIIVIARIVTSARSAASERSSSPASIC
jgi:hypothetical protein